MAEAVLALNAGSSSLKFGLYEAASDWAPRTLATGAVRTVCGQQPHYRVQAPDGTTLADEPSTFSAHDAPVERLIEWIEARFPGTGITAVGHRVVHGGMDFGDPIEVDDRTLARIDVLTPLAPLHQPASLEPIRRIKAFRPDLRQFACFDTAFHRTIVPPASRFALPRTFERQGVRRYGFHGLSYESIIAQLKRTGDAEALKPDSRIIVAHLGNGASLCAMRGLKSIDTTMGFSTLDGLVMGTRPGALDPGVLLYLLREQGLPPERLEQLLYRESGLLGVSGISSDVATLLGSDAPDAAEALELFAFQAARQVAALAATLGGLDRIIFTGGIGEHAPAVRKMIVARLQWLGAELDNEANDAGSITISSRSSSILIERRQTEEELAIGRHVLMLLDR